MSRQRKAAAKPPAGDLEPYMGGPPVVTLQRLEETTLARFVAHLPDYLRLLKHIFSFDEAYPYRRSLLSQLDGDVRHILTTYEETIAYVTGKTLDWPHDPKIPLLMNAIESFFIKDGQVRADLMECVNRDRAQVIEFARYLLTKNQAARQTAPDGTVTVWPVLSKSQKKLLKL